MRKIILSFFILTATLANAQQPKDTASYVLIGKFQDFELLFKSVLTPGDVTPNQQKALAEWIKSIQAIPVRKEDEKQPVKK